MNREHINKVIEISIDAGKAIMDIYKTDFDAEKKADNSPLTKADLLSHKIISESLKDLTPEIPVLSEESSKISLNERMKWKKYWLVDPLDGTKEFIKKNGEFTTNIALIDNCKPIFGVIHVPVSKETYWGLEKKGSYFIDANFNELKMNVSVKNDGPIRIVASRSHPSQELQAYLERIENYELIKVGSSLKFCLIAKGDADCYPRFGPTSEWDTAAGEIIARSAGAIIVDLENKPLKYNKVENYLNPSFIVTNSSENETLGFR